MSTPPTLVRLHGAPARPATRTRTVPLTAEAVAVAAVALAFVLLAALTWNAWGDLAHDTGYDWVAADRVAHGLMPYEDFTYYYGPLGVALLGGAFALMGTTVGVAVAFGLVAAAAAVALTYRVAREVTRPAGAAIAAVLAATAALATGNNNLVTPHTVSASLAVVLCLGVLALACAYARTERRALLVAAGAGVGLTALTRPEFFAAIAGTVGLWLVLRIAAAPAGADRRREIVRALACAATAAAIPVVVYGAIATRVSPHALLTDNIFPTDELDAGGRAVLKISAPLTAGSVIELLGRLAAYAAFAAAIVAVAEGIRRGGRARRVGLAVVTVVAVGFVAALAVNPEAVRSRLSWAYGWIPAGAAVVLVYLVWRVRGRRGGWAASDQAALLVTALLAALAAKNYGAFFPQPNPRFAQSALYGLPFAAIFMVWLHERIGRGREGAALGLAVVAALALAGFVLTGRDGIAERDTVRGPGGQIAAPASQGAAYQAAVDVILSSTRPGDPILLAPQLTALYTLTGRADPLPEISLLPGALGTQEAESRAIRRMARVRLAIVDRRQLREYGFGSFGTGYDTRLGAWLRADFRRIATYRGVGDGAVTLDIWQRSAAR